VVADNVLALATEGIDKEIVSKSISNLIRLRIGFILSKSRRKI
jgi:hypothetical protein